MQSKTEETVKEEIPPVLICPACGKGVEEIKAAVSLFGPIRVLIKHGGDSCILTPGMTRKLKEQVHEIAEMARKTKDVDKSKSM